MTALRICLLVKCSTFTDRNAIVGATQERNSIIPENDANCHKNRMITLKQSYCLFPKESDKPNEKAYFRHRPASCAFITKKHFHAPCNSDMKQI